MADNHQVKMFSLKFPDSERWIPIQCYDLPKITMDYDMNMPGAFNHVRYRSEPYSFMVEEKVFNRFQDVFFRSANSSGKMDKVVLSSIPVNFSGMLVEMVEENVSLHLYRCFIAEIEGWNHEGHVKVTLEFDNFHVSFESPLL